MRRILALDTTGPWGEVALLERDARDEPHLVAELGLQIRQTHARDLLPRVGALLSLAGWHRTDIDGFVAVRGPGSFTGVRIGLGTVRGLALAAGAPALGVDTLTAMAQALGPCEHERVPLLDAGRGDVYGARFDPGGSPPEPKVAPWVGPPARLDVFDSLAPAVYFGSGARRLDPVAGWRRARAPRGIAAAAGALALQGASCVIEATPLYLRPPDALLGRP